MSRNNRPLAAKLTRLHLTRTPIERSHASALEDGSWGSLKADSHTCLARGGLEDERGFGCGEGVRLGGSVAQRHLPS